MNAKTKLREPTGADAIVPPGPLVAWKLPEGAVIAPTKRFDLKPLPPGVVHIPSFWLLPGRSVSRCAVVAALATAFALGVLVGMLALG